MDITKNWMFACFYGGWDKSTFKYHREACAQLNFQEEMNKKTERDGKEK